MVCYKRFRFGKIIELAEEIYDDLKQKTYSAWSFATSGVYTNDREILTSPERYDSEKIVNDFEGWGGCKVLKDYPYDGNDLILIGDMYGGGSFASLTLPEGIEYCEHYQDRNYWIESIAQMMCAILDEIDGFGVYNYDAYTCLEKDY